MGPLRPTDLWVPWVPSKDEYPRGNGDNRNYNAQVIGRLKDGVTIAQALAQMEQITAGLKAQYPRWFRDRWVGVTPLHESVVGKSRGWMLLLLGAVAFVLLIACVNVANLMLARATGKARDVSVRAALGATRWQLARGLLAESLVLSIAGTALGVLLALWGVEMLRASLPPSLPRLNDVGIDLRVLVAAAAAALVDGSPSASCRRGRSRVRTCRDGAARRRAVGHRGTRARSARARHCSSPKSRSRSCSSSAPGSSSRASSS